MGLPLTNQITRDIQTAYGSLSLPNWSFVEKRYANNPYLALMDQFGDLGSVQETTDLNDDVSVVVAITLGGKIGICVKLSLVGKYACISDSAGAFLSRDELKNDKHTSQILALLAEKDVFVFNGEELVRKIEFGEGSASVYRVLFSADELEMDGGLWGDIGPGGPG